MKSVLRPLLFLSTVTLAVAAPAKPTVNVVIAARATNAVELVLPASLQAYQEATLYARTGGYLSKWLVDLGDKVTAGQTLAIIEGPELDQELNQARATLAQTKANAELANATSKRWHDLAERNAVSKQEAEEKSAAALARAADTQAAGANVSRLTQLKSLQTIVAPFDGVITSRGAEIGALITTDASRRELFRMVAVNPLRVYASIPQSYMRSIKPGLDAEVLVNEFPGKPFPGKIVRVAGALDSVTRTLTTEIQLPNEDGQLLPGMFVQVRFRLKPTEPTIVLPSNAVIIRAEGPQVATIAQGDVIHFQKIQIGRDFGTQIEVLSGLNAGTRIVANPSDSLTEGIAVEPLIPAPPAKK
jgi:multidrug efflux system membrane fusion protein